MPSTWINLLVPAIFFCAANSHHIPPVREILPPPALWWNLNESRAIPGNEFLSFQRDAVESPPAEEQQINFVDHQEYGSQRFPLRDAVEALPVIDSKVSSQLRDGQDSERVPLRDAVEHREAPFLGGIDHESIWIEPLAPPTLRRTQQILDPKVVCYLDSQAVYRTEPFSVVPQTIPDFKCTHVIYTAATLDPQKLTIVPRDKEYDQVKGGYNAATALRSKDPSLRVLISLSPPEPKLFDEVVKERCSLHCEKLAQSILYFLERNRFDGIEIDWQNSSEHFPELKLLLKIIRKSLSPYGYVLTTAIRPEDPVDREIADLVDLILLRSWRDSPGNRREKLAFHPAPLRFVARFANKWIQQVGSKRTSKLVLGVPIFGQGYTLKFGNDTDAGAPVVGPGMEGMYTKRRDGRLAYYEVCEKLEEPLWISGRDEEGPYVKRSDQWIGFEDPLSARIKAAYVRSTGLGGMSLWSLDMDDFQGICGDPWPMLNAATKALGVYDNEKMQKCYTEGLYSDPDNCSGFYSCVNGLLHHGHCGMGRFFNSTKGRCVVATPEICKPGQSDHITTENKIHSENQREHQKPERLEVQQDDGPRVVCYVTSWALYRNAEGKFVPERLDANLCTDIIYAFAGLNPDTLLIQPFDPWADIENNLYERVTSIEGPRVLLAIGGWTDSSGNKYSHLISNGASRRKFVAGTIAFLKKHNFQGLSLEWNYPKCWQSDCRKGPDSDKPNFTKLILELRREFDKQEPKLTLAVALSGYKEVIDEAYEVADISKAVDFMSVMTYDYHGAWESRTGHLAPLYSSPRDNNPFYNANFTLEYLVSLGAERSKLLLGIPLYGQAYRLSRPDQNDLGDSSTGPGSPGEFTRQPGMLAYYEICDKIRTQGWMTGSGPSAYHRNQWVGYENKASVSEKGEYINRNGYGGASMWTVDLDDFLNRCCSESYPLLKSVNRALGRLSTKPPSTEDCRRPPEPVTPQAPTLTTHSDAAEGGPRPTVPMTTKTTTKATTWPTWTERPSTTMHTTRTTWPTWTWTEKPSKIPEKTTTTMTSTTTRIPEKPITTTTTTTTTTTMKPSSDTTTVTSATICIIGEYAPDPQNCGSYFRCVLGELRREQCAPGLHWDAKRGLCDWPSVAKCQDGKMSLLSGYIENGMICNAD